MITFNLVKLFGALAEFLLCVANGDEELLSPYTGNSHISRMTLFETVDWSFVFQSLQLIRGSNPKFSVIFVFHLA